MQKERKTSLRERKRKEKRLNDILALERERKSQTGERERKKERIIGELDGKKYLELE